MRAVLQTEFGGPEVLRPAQVPEPALGDGDVLVRVRASGVNPIDAAVRAGFFHLLGEPPFILGWDVSGVVEAVAGTTRFAPGDEVFGMPMFPRAASAYAELVAAPAGHLARKPAAWSHVEAAAVPLVGLTAWRGLVGEAGLAAGQRVLVHGAGGGLGHIAVQIAKARGATVVATASTGKVRFVRGLGADQVIDHSSERFEDLAGPVDLVLDAVGGDVARRSLALLRSGGRLLMLAGHDRELIAAAQSRGIVASGVPTEPDHAVLEALAALGEAGHLTPHVARTFPLEQAAAAHEALALKPAGKIVLIP